MSEFEPFLNCLVDLDPAPIAAGGTLRTWLVKSCSDGRIVLEGEITGKVFELWMKPKEVVRPLGPLTHSRPVWKLHNQLYHNGRRFVGSNHAQ